MTRKILVCGGRNFCEWEYMHRILDTINPDEIVAGHAAGADAGAEQWGYENGKIVHSHPAHWDIYEKAAGPIRNAEMLQCHPDIGFVLAFSGGRGTKNMIEQAHKKGVPVLLADGDK